MLKQEVAKRFVSVILPTIYTYFELHYKTDVFLSLSIFSLGYLLPIINKLLADKELLSRPPYAVVLLPSIELCQQASNAIKTLKN